MAHLTEMFYADDEYNTTIIFNGSLTTAYVSDNRTGLMAKGNAKHNPEDVYKQEVGADLAVARARSRLFNKIAKRLAR